MEMHERSQKVLIAQTELAWIFSKYANENGLTFGEQIQMLGNMISNIVKYQIREERHPDDPDKGGDDA